MLLVTLTAITFTFFIYSVNAITDYNSLIEITDSTYSNLVAAENNNIWLIMFYAPWCHHCKKIRPSFEKLPNLSLSSNIRYGVIDATVNAESATK